MQLLVQSLHAGPDVHGVADDRVLGAFRRAHVSGEHGARMDADSHPQCRQAARLPTGVQGLQPHLHLEPRAHGVEGVFRVVHRRPVDRHDGIADEIIHDTPLLQHRLDHHGEVLVELLGHLVRRHGFGQGGEVAEVGEQDGHDPPLSAQGPIVAIDPLHHLATDVLMEAPPDATSLQGIVQRAAEANGEDRCQEINPEPTREAGRLGQRESRQGGSSQRNQQGVCGTHHDEEGAQRQTKGELEKEARPPGDRPNLAPAEESVQDVGVDLHPVHQAAGRRVGVAAFGEGRADQDDPIPERVVLRHG